MSLDRRRYSILAELIADTLGARKDPDTMGVVTEQIVRAINADPSVGQSGGVSRVAQALEGIASSLHVLQGLYGLECAARGVVSIETIEQLVSQAITAYNLRQGPDESPPV